MRSHSRGSRAATGCYSSSVRVTDHSLQQTQTFAEDEAAISRHYAKHSQKRGKVNQTFPETVSVGVESKCAFSPAHYSKVGVWKR